MKVGWSGPPPTLVLTSAIIVMTIGLASCGHEQEKSDVVARSSNAGKVATLYMDAIMAADFDAASRYVVADQRGMIKALALSSGPGTLVKMSGHMSVGRVRYRHDHAQVFFVGKMCRQARKTNGGLLRPECVDNHDSSTSDPKFIVHLARNDSGWRVVLELPPAIGSRQPATVRGSN